MVLPGLCYRYVSGISRSVLRFRKASLAVQVGGCSVKKHTMYLRARMDLNLALDPIRVNHGKLKPVRVNVVLTAFRQSCCLGAVKPGGGGGGGDIDW